MAPLAVSKNFCFYAARSPRRPAVIFSLVLSIPHLLWLSPADAKAVPSMWQNPYDCLNHQIHLRLFSREILCIRIRIVLFKAFNTNIKLYLRYFTPLFPVSVYQSAYPAFPSRTLCHLFLFSKSHQLLSAPTNQNTFCHIPRRILYPFSFPLSSPFIYLNRTHTLYLPIRFALPYALSTPYSP